MEPKSAKSILVSIVALYGSQGLPMDAEQSGSGVGKDEVARILREKHGFIHLKFADALRDRFYDIYDLPLNMKGDKGFELSTFSPEVDYPEMQWMDSKTVNENMIAFAEVERKRNPLVFVQHLARDIVMLSTFHKHPHLKLCVSDMRQFNEYCFLDSLGASFWEIQRANPSRPKQALDGQLLEIMRNRSSIAIANNGNIEDLYNPVYAASASINSCPTEYCQAILKGWLNRSPHKSQGVTQ